MAGKFSFKRFSEIDLDDPFFIELKGDYLGNEHSTGFIEWFRKKSTDGSTALVFEDDKGVGAFIYLKNETEAIELTDQILPAVPRIKIGTLRLAERYRGQRLGEGAIGLALWHWQKSKVPDIYVTVFEKRDDLIGLFEKFGFHRVGINKNNECVYVRNRASVDYSDPYKSFPFINPNFPKAGYVLVNDSYHDELFPYSEVKGELQPQLGLAVTNGISKIYVGASRPPHYNIGEPVLIYRIYKGTSGAPQHKSCITSFCVITDIIEVKSFGRYLMQFDELIARIGNKSVFNENDLLERYDKDKNVVVIEMLYYGYFGEGNNVNKNWLDTHGYWSKSGEYPTSVQLTPTQFKEILTEGNVDVSNVIIN